MFKLFDMFSLPICFEVTKRWIVLVVWWWFEDTCEFVFWLTVFPFNIFKCWCRGNTILFDVDRAKNIPDYLDGSTLVILVEFSVLLKLVFPILKKKWYALILFIRYQNNLIYSVMNVNIVVLGTYLVPIQYLLFGTYSVPIHYPEK